MEYSIIHTDLVDSEIKPQELLKEYCSYLEQDIEKILSKQNLHSVGCPSSGERAIRTSFEKMGMRYCISERFGNAYISPRPDKKQLAEFYKKSQARRFWLKELWPKTNKVRKRKIICPQMEWVNTFVQQYLLGDKFLSVGEYYANQWGYFEEVKEQRLNWDYFFIEAMFDPSWCDFGTIGPYILSGKESERCFDVICLFDALDRCENPTQTLEWVNQHLNPGGLCFITCSLASGFEFQILGKDSNVIMPPERMNLFSYEGLIHLIGQFNKLQILEFSTPGVLDIPNIIDETQNLKSGLPSFMRYIIETRNDPNLFLAFQDFLQMNKLSSFGRLVLKKEG